MSTNQPDHVEQAFALDPFEQRIYLSMRGLTVWRLLTVRGVNRNLLLEMYAVEETFDAFLDGVNEVIDACLRDARFTDVTSLSDHVQQQVKNLSEVHQSVFWSQERMLLVQDLIGHRPAWYGFDDDGARVVAEDARVTWLDRLGTFMVDTLYKDGDMYRPGYREAITALWFDLCHIAVAADPARG